MGPIIGPHKVLKFLRLKPAARLKVLISLLKQLRPIPNPTGQSPCMDIVERFTGRKSPVTLCVINKEATIRWRPVRLDGAKIGADDVRLRVIFGHFQGPFTGAGADV